MAEDVVFQLIDRVLSGYFAASTLDLAMSTRACVTIAATCICTLYRVSRPVACSASSTRPPTMVHMLPLPVPTGRDEMTNVKGCSPQFLDHPSTRQIPPTTSDGRFSALHRRQFSAGTLPPPTSDPSFAPAHTLEALTPITALQPGLVIAHLSYSLEECLVVLATSICTLPFA